LKNVMHTGDRTHTKHILNSCSMEQVLVAARDASHWEAGAPNVRGGTRSDLGGEGTRRPCTVVPRGPATADAEPLKQRGAA
jgi:hypothetical protein